MENGALSGRRSRFRDPPHALGTPQIDDHHFIFYTTIYRYGIIIVLGIIRYKIPPMKEDIWHYPRADLARQYLDVFKTGLTHRLALFAPRRMGKTEFLVLDLAPTATRRRYLVLYVSLWGDVNAPHHALLDTLETGLDASSKKRFAFRKLMESAVKKVRVDSSFGVGAEVEFADAPTAPSKSELADVRRLLKSLAEKRPGKVLLMLDEVQHLTTHARFEPLQYALRTALDTLRGQVNVVFTGSSRLGMRRMFGSNKAPFYQFAEQLPFPNLDRDFVSFLGKTYKRVTKRQLDEDAVWSHFQRLSHNPFYLVSIIKLVALDPGISLGKAYDRVFDGLARQSNYEGKWKRLKPLDRQVYLAIASAKSLYTADQLAEFSRQVGKNVTSTTVQKSVRRLLDAHMVSPGEERGRYVTELPGFAEWCVRQRLGEKR